MSADLRLLIAHALNSHDLSPSDLRETDVDRLAALAFADPLGAALWRIKWGGDKNSLPRATALLVRNSRHVCSDRTMRHRLCVAALNEWLDERCRRCRGRGHLAATATAPVRLCQPCGGTGKARRSDANRARGLGLELSVYRKWERRFAAVQSIIVDAELRAFRDIRRQLKPGERVAAVAEKPLPAGPGSAGSFHR